MKSTISMKSASRSRRGSATIIALSLVGIVGGAALAITGSLAADYRRTRLALQDAQLRQLLLASQFAIEEKAKTWGEIPDLKRWEIPLPAGGSSSSASLIVTGQVENGRVLFRVEAAMDRRHAAQQIELERTRSRWRIVGLELTP